MQDITCIHTHSLLCNFIIYAMFRENNCTNSIGSNVLKIERYQIVVVLIVDASRTRFIHLTWRIILCRESFSNSHACDTQRKCLNK